MRRAMRHHARTGWTLSLLLAATACTPRPAAEPPDAGPAAPDAGPTAPPVVTASALIGGFSATRPTATLFGRATSVAIIASQSVVADPATLGLPAIGGGLRVFAGLTVLDTATGLVRLYDARDGLPTIRYRDEFADFGDATTSTFSLAWLVPDQAFAAAGFEHVIRGAVDEAGTWAFTSTRLRAPGRDADARLMSVAVSEGELFVATDQGVAVLDGGTLAVKRWPGLGLSLDGPWVHEAKSVDVGGPGVAVRVGPAGQPPSHVVLLRPRSEADGVAYGFEPGVQPGSLGPTPAGVAIGLQHPDRRGSIAGLVADVTGRIEQVSLVDAEELARAAADPLVPRRIVFDATRERLLVGGALLPGGAGKGLVAFDAPGGVIGGPGRALVPARDEASGLLPWQFDVLDVDPQGRVWMAGAQQCSEHKLRAVGLQRLELEGDEVRVVRPIVSGVRVRETGPDGHEWLGLRDELPGLQCDGVPVQQSVCRLKADGSCEVWVPRLSAGDSLISPNPGPTAIAFGSADRRELAVATKRDATYVRSGDSTRALMTQLDPGVALDMTAAAWGEPGALWLGSEMSWARYPDLDEEAINDRGPHGLGYLELDGEGAPLLTRRYVRVASDQTDRDVAGLPSNTVWDVKPLPGARRALVACGVERDDMVYDHLLGTPNERDLKGGLALVEDTQVRVIAPPADRVFGDVVALASVGERWLALDAALGIFELDLAARTSSELHAAPWTAPERALSFAADAAGRIAVGTTTSLWIKTNGSAWSRVEAELGYVWRVGFEPGGVAWAGTDQGLARFSFDGAALPALALPTGLLPLDPWPMPAVCDGKEGCVCKEPRDCLDGLDCACPPEGDCTCVAADPCAVEPGARFCACVPERGCTSGLSCLCDASGERCACDVDPAACTDTSGCPCRSADDCPGGFRCNDAGQCEEMPDCAAHCLCGEANGGCPPGFHCQGGFAGNSCLPD